MPSRRHRSRVPNEVISTVAAAVDLGSRSGCPHNARRVDDDCGSPGPARATFDRALDLEPDVTCRTGARTESLSTRVAILPTPITSSFASSHRQQSSTGPIRVFHDDELYAPAPQRCHELLRDRTLRTRQWT